MLPYGLRGNRAGSARAGALVRLTRKRRVDKSLSDSSVEQEMALHPVHVRFDKGQIGVWSPGQIRGCTVFKQVPAAVRESL